MAGTYTVTLTRVALDGAITSTTRTVVVQADQLQHYFVGPAGNDANDGRTAATAWASVAKWASVAGKPNTSVELLGGMPLTYGGPPIRLTTSCVVDLGTSTVTTTAGALFDGWVGQTAGAVITGGAIVGPGTKSGGAVAVTVRGLNVAIIGTKIGTGYRGIEIITPLASETAGVLVQDVEQMSPCHSEYLSGWYGCSMLTITGCTVIDSTDECPIRFDFAGAAAGLLIEGCRLRRASGSGKGILSLRNASDATVYGNEADDADLGTDTSPGSTDTRTTRVRFEANELAGGVCVFSAKRVASAIRFTGNNVRTGSASLPGLHLTAGDVSDVTWTGNTGAGNLIGRYGVGTVVGFAADVVQH